MFNLKTSFETYNNINTKPTELQKNLVINSIQNPWSLYRNYNDSFLLISTIHKTSFVFTSMFLKFSYIPASRNFLLKNSLKTPVSLFPTQMVLRVFIFSKLVLQPPLKTSPRLIKIKSHLLPWWCFNVNERCLSLRSRHTVQSNR